MQDIRLNSQLTPGKYLRWSSSYPNIIELNIDPICFTDLQEERLGSSLRLSCLKESGVIMLRDFIRLVDNQRDLQNFFIKNEYIYHFGKALVNVADAKEFLREIKDIISGDFMADYLEDVKEATKALELV